MKSPAYFSRGETMTQQSYEDIRIQYDNRVARIVINRPQKLNAIRVQTYRELISALREADDSDECQVISIEGEGGQFTAGNDLADLVDAKKEDVMQGVQGIFDTVAGLKKVLVAVVEGVAVGIGTTLLLHCDIVVASEKTKFRLPFANLGVSPEGAASSLLPRAIGEKMAQEVLLTGRFFTGAEALKWGLVNALTEPGKAHEKAEEYISMLLQQPLASLLATKELIQRSKGDISAVVAGELKVFAALLESESTRARIKSLLK
jgi:enoyl-CoA hydratase/carnithine racemase